MVHFRPPNKDGCEYLTPSAIREKFGYHEESTWAHLLDGTWAGVLYAEFVTKAGKRSAIDDTYLPPALIREIVSGLYEGEIRDFLWGDSVIRVKYRKDSVMVLCAPDATPELFRECAQIEADANKTTTPEATPKAPLTGPSTTTHHVQRRNRHPLANLIEQSARTANCNDVNSIWSELVSMAISEKRPVPMHGFAAGEGIRYRGSEYDKSEVCDVFTKRALREYLRRQAKN